MLKKLMRAALLSGCCAIAALGGSVFTGLAAAKAAEPVKFPSKLLMVYSDSWRENQQARVAADTALARSPAYLNLIALSFGKPDMVYHGNLSLFDTGYNYQFSGELLANAIRLVKHRHPATKVILSIGSAAYNGWDHLNAEGIARLVRDLGADGVDIDYEPDTTCVTGPDGKISCPTDALFIKVTHELRAALPRPMILSVAGWHVGAYGEGDFKHAPPDYSPHAGFMLGLLRSSAAKDLDLVSIDAYDAGPTYKPMQAYQAYRAAWPGKLALGVEVPMKGATGPFYTVANTYALAKQVAADPLGGMMVYSMLEPPFPEPATPDHPTGAMLEQAACRGLGMKGCDQPPPPPGH